MTGHLPFALPDIGEAEIEAVNRAMRSGWLSSGPKVVEFEQAFADRIADTVQAVAVNSATAGLHLALEAAGIGPGDEVLVPTWTFTATAEVVRHLGAVPVLVDVCRETLNMSFEGAQAAITKRTRAFMPVHFGGFMVDPVLTRDFAIDNSLVCIEDAAHAFPASRGGVPIGGGSSLATVFSFYATKTMTTGEGGMVVSSDPALLDRIRTMRLHGISRNAYDRYRSTTPTWHYDVVAPGYKYNLTDPAAAMGLVQLRRAESMRQRRAEIASLYREGLADTDVGLPCAAQDGDIHSWHLFVVRLPGRIERSRFIAQMAQMGVGTSVHFIPLHMHPYWANFVRGNDPSFPVADEEFLKVVSLPCYSSMNDYQVAMVLRSVRTALGL